MTTTCQAKLFLIIVSLSLLIILPHAAYAQEQSISQQKEDLSELLKNPALRSSDFISVTREASAATTDTDMDSLSPLTVPIMSFEEISRNLSKQPVEVIAEVERLFQPNITNPLLEEADHHFYLPLVQQNRSASSVSDVDAVHAAQTDGAIFAHLDGPIGITTDRLGNVFTISDATLSSLLTKFAPNGQELLKTTVSVQPASLGQLTTDMTFGYIWHLWRNGLIIVYHPDTLQAVGAVDISSMPFDATRVYDIATGTVRDMSGAILSFQANYGDIAVWIRDVQAQIYDIYVSGISVGTPFVAQVRVTPQRSAIRVLASSSGSSAPDNNLPRGLAINPQGLVLTTLALAGLGDRLTAFSVDFPDNVNALRPTIVFNEVAVASRGMTADQNGNFYVATSMIGIPACGIDSSGATLILSADLQQGSCLAFGSVLMQTWDIAVNPEVTKAYITTGNGDIYSLP